MRRNQDVPPSVQARGRNIFFAYCACVCGLAAQLCDRAAASQQPTAMVGSSVAVRKADAAGKAGAKSGSRKNKASWRKNIDLSEVEASLEASRADERGGDGLFTLDRSGDHGGRPQKTLKSLEILQNKSAVPAVAHLRGRRNVLTAADDGEAVARLRRAGVPAKKVRDRLRRAAGKTVTDQLGGINKADQDKLQDYTGVATVADRDLWDDEPAPKSTASAPKARYQPEWVADPRRDHVPKPPKSLSFQMSDKRGAVGKAPKANGMHEQVALARKVPAVQLPHPGMSYNPEAETHEELLNRAYEVELAKFKEEEAQVKLRSIWARLSAAEKAEVLAENGATDTAYRGMQIDVPAEGSDSDEEVHVDGEEEADDEVALIRERQRQKAIKGKRKTTAQKHRRAKAQAQVHANAAAKAYNRWLSAAPGKLGETPTLDAAARARLQAAQRRREAKLALLEKTGMRGQKIAGQRLSLTMGQGHDSVQLPEQLSENLRAMRAEGNLFRERFQSMQVRALAEPQRKMSASQQKKFKDSRKASWKAVERFAFKNFK